MTATVKDKRETKLCASKTNKIQWNYCLFANAISMSLNVAIVVVLLQKSNSNKQVRHRKENSINIFITQIRFLRQSKISKNRELRGLLLNVRYSWVFKL